ncbi:MAG: UvrD-helicase domain-containing protein [Clostridia bacterium]|nr:UvrD-helicase domain-containing protein [Clostridia bacterium]
MVFIVVPILIIIIFIKHTNDENDSAKIDAFYSKLESAKESFISDEKKSELQNKYFSFYRRISKKFFKTAKDTSFIYIYLNLNNEIKNSNKLYLEKQEIIKAYNDKIKESDSFFAESTELRRNYITTIDRDNILKKYQALYDYFTDESFQKANLEIPQDFIYTYRNFRKIVFQWNQEYIKEEEKNNEEFFGDIDGKSLDYQQRDAVIIDDINNLIVAGAGSGKTLTIAAKVKYLVEKKNVNPDEILLLSFGKKAADEMAERINNKLGISVKSYTFHKLGLGIINQYEHPNISDDGDMTKIVSNYFKTVVLKDYTTLKKIFDFFLFYLNVPKSLQNFDSLGSYIEEQRAQDLESLQSKYKSSCLMDVKINDMKRELKTISGEKLRSMEEVMIANYLFVNGINYEYEKEYPYKDPNNPYGKYHPDFYFTDYDIYLEHFGITKDNTLPWLSPIEEKKYLESMDWKRKFHKANGTKLIETYSYYNQENRLITELQKLLDENEIKSNPRNIQDIYEKVYANDSDYHFKEFEKLICTFIQLYKTNGYDSSNIDNLKSYEDSFKAKRNNIFLEIVKPIIEYYEKTLKDRNQIDFNDMINLAIKYINNYDIPFNYKYIIVDEYQDISFGRYQLIKSIITHSNAKLFCVGDDWQSIYRFTGSDLDLFTNFEKYFGESSLTKIEKTYRNSQELLDITKAFIEKNPEQIKKNLVSDKRIVEPIKIMKYVSDKKQALQMAIADIYWHFGEEAQILLLGRNNNDINDYIDTDFSPIGNTTYYLYNKYPKMKIQFMTAHSSKGLEVDNVIIINMKNTINGFPNRIADDEVLSLVLQNKDQYEFAEERRLFYVALTRTRCRTYLIVPSKQESLFLKDLTSTYQINEYKTKYEKDVTEGPNCPRCKKGTLVIRENEGKKFLGCSYFPQCDYTVNDISILKSQKICPRCGGYMVWKENRNGGKFLACTNREYCGHTESSNNNRQIGFRIG